jgi:hypothetical protein
LRDWFAYAVGALEHIMREKRVMVCPPNATNEDEYPVFLLPENENGLGRSADIHFARPVQGNDGNFEIDQALIASCRHN